MEDELFEAMRKVADWFNWDLSKRDPGPVDDRNDIAEGNVWPETPLEAELATAARNFDGQVKALFPRFWE